MPLNYGSGFQSSSGTGKGEVNSFLSLFHNLPMKIQPPLTDPPHLCLPSRGESSQAPPHRCRPRAPGSSVPASCPRLTGSRAFLEVAGEGPHSLWGGKEGPFRPCPLSSRSPGMCS